jgi:signal transduction histidine kinase/tetratricopeptide (TPR) repeat protein
MAQKNNLKTDSLKTILAESKEEKSIPILIELSKAYFNIDLDESLSFAGKALELTKQYRKDELEAYTSMQIADIYFEMSRFKVAIDYYEQALNYFYEQRSSSPKIYIYTKLGHSEKMLSNLDNALFYYQKPLNLYLAEKNNKISEVYNHIGIIYKLQNKYELSLEFHQKALTASNLAFDQSETANSLNLIGSLYWKNNYYDSCLFYYEKSLEIYRELTDTISESNVLSNIGVFYKGIGEFKKALNYNEKALDLRIIKNDKKAIAKSYNSIGSIYLSANKIKKALDFYLKSLEIREAINDILGVAQTLNNIALVYKNNNNFDSALEYFNKSLFNYYQIGNLSYIANSINQIGSIYKKQNKYDLALKNYLDALRIKQELGDENNTASILTNIGIIYSDINNYPRALESYTKSLEIKRKFGIKKDISYSLHIIGNTYVKLRKYDQALNYFNEALALRQEIGDKVNIANSLKSIGNTYLKLKDYHKSISFLNDALKIRDEIGDIKGVSDILNDIGNFYNKTNNQEKALEYFQRTIETSLKTGDKYLIALCYRKIAVIYNNQKNFVEGKDLLYKSLQIGQDIGNLELIKNAHFELYRYYKLTSNSDKALDSYIHFTEFKDSIINKINSQRLIEIQMNFELEESYNQLTKIEDEITELTAEKQIKDLELRKQKNVRNYLIIIVLITLSSIALIYNLFLNKRKTNSLLKDKIKEADFSNKKLQESEDNLKILNATKDKFFSIIAHDLRNPFNALHGLTKHLMNNFDEFDSNEIKQFIEIIYNSADDQLELLENLLYWSRTQRGKIQFTPQEIDLNDIIQKNFDLVKMNAQRKKINLISDLNSKYKITADYDMIMAIIRNLISNAIKFSNKDSFIKLSVRDLKDFTEISVIDNGVGISQENIQRLFRIDVNYTTTGTSEEQGSGLGLILCKEFVETHNGKIWVESILDKGSIFKFTISKKLI